MKPYRIRGGASFVTHDEQGNRVIKTGGDTIELEDDVAASHADKIEPMPEGEGAQAPAGEEQA